MCVETLLYFDVRAAHGLTRDNNPNAHTHTHIALATLMHVSCISEVCPSHELYTEQSNKRRDILVETIEAKSVCVYTRVCMRVSVFVWSATCIRGLIATSASRLPALLSPRKSTK